MIPTEQSVESMTILVLEEIRVKASLETTFAALLEELEDMHTSDGTAMPMKLEPWPGGRWYRDLGNKNGHYWAAVQSIKRPTLLEFSGPLMMSHPVSNNVQYRLSEEGGVTVIKFRHAGFGIVPEEFRTGVKKGWGEINDRIRARAEAKKK